MYVIVHVNISLLDWRVSQVPICTRIGSLAESFCNLNLELFIHIKQSNMLNCFAKSEVLYKLLVILMGSGLQYTVNSFLCFCPAQAYIYGK